MRNKIFFKRYIVENVAEACYSSFPLKPKENTRRIPLFLWSALRKITFWVLKYPLSLYFMAHFLRGKVDMPYFEVSLTTKCTLRCEACSVMMQYFSKDTQYTSTLGEIQKTLDALLNVVDSVRRARIIGGEPLLYKDLAQVVGCLGESPKVKRFDIVTNGTLDFKEDVLDALKAARKAWVTISDYSASPNLKLPLQQESIISSLKKRKIEYMLLRNWRGAQSQWHDPGKIYKRGRPKEETIRNFRACMLPCVSVMSSECAKDANLAPLEAAFICPVASSLSRLKGLGEFEGDFMDIAAATRERIIEFYARDYFKACDYCPDMWAERRYIAPAVQTKETFSLSS